MYPMKMYGTHGGQSDNSTSYKEQHPVHPPAWLQIQALNRKTIDYVHRRHPERNERREAEWL